MTGNAWAKVQLEKDVGVGIARKSAEGAVRVLLCALRFKQKQSQKRYMVSVSLCPLISFLDVSFSVSFVVRGQRPRRGR